MYVELVGQSFRYLVLISYWSNRCQFNSVLSKKTCKWDKWIHLNHSKRVVCKLWYLSLSGSMKMEWVGWGLRHWPCSYSLQAVWPKQDLGVGNSTGGTLQLWPQYTVCNHNQIFGTENDTGDINQTGSMHRVCDSGWVWGRQCVQVWFVRLTSVDLAEDGVLWAKRGGYSSSLGRLKLGEMTRLGRASPAGTTKPLGYITHRRHWWD